MHSRRRQWTSSAWPLNLPPRAARAGEPDGFSLHVVRADVFQVFCIYAARDEVAEAIGRGIEPAIFQTWPRASERQATPSSKRFECSVPDGE
jgi:hypothetical protein